MKNSTSALRKRRRELSLTLEEVGNYVGVSKATVSKWENGNIKNMKMDKVIRLAEILRLEYIDILHMRDGEFQQEKEADISGKSPFHTDIPGESPFHPEDIAAMRRNALSDGTKEPEYTIAYVKDGQVVYEKFSKEDYDLILHTLERLNGKALKD